MSDLRERIGRQIEDPGSKRRYVRELFASVARRYDLTNDVMSLGLHRRWKRTVLDLAGLEPGMRVLDLAAGTGDLALGAARRLAAAGPPDGGRAQEAGRSGEGGPSPPGLVVAADLTPEMLRVGRGREGADRVAWMQADALALPFADAALDRVVIGYGLRNFADLPAALREIRRCLAPGGRLVTLDFGKPRAPWLARLYLRYLEISTAAAGWLLHRNAEAYLYIPESLRRYPDQRELLELLHEAGFRRSGYVDLLLGTMAVHFADRGP